MIRGSRQQSGFTLVELGLVLLIVALILIAAIVLFPSLFSSSRSENAVKSAVSIIDAIRSDFQTSRSGYAGLNEATAIHLGNVLPSNYIVDQQCASSSPRCLKSEWNQPVAIGPANINGGTSNGFQIVYSGLPASDCASFVQDIWQYLVGLDVGIGSGGMVSSPPPYTLSYGDGIAIGGTGLIVNQLNSNLSRFYKPSNFAATCSQNPQFVVTLIAQ